MHTVQTQLKCGKCDRQVHDALVAAFHLGERYDYSRNAPS